MAEELWQGLGNKTIILSAEWPSFDEKRLVVSQVEIVVQEKGKVRGTITIAVGASEDEVVEVMKQNEKFVSLLANATKRIYVQDKIINLV
jgi:leucyl-tRNA synthetase